MVVSDVTSKRDLNPENSHGNDWTAQGFLGVVSRTKLSWPECKPKLRKI